MIMQLVYLLCTDHYIVSNNIVIIEDILKSAYNKWVNYRQIISSSIDIF